MATTTDTSSLISEKIDLAVAAQERRDYDTALMYLRSARMLAFNRPSTMQKGTAVVGYTLNDIDAMINDLKEQASASVGIQSQSLHILGRRR